MNKTILSTGVFFGFTAVIIGAFGAHGLENLVDAKSIASYKTGAQYQMYHALLLLVLGLIPQLTAKQKKPIFYVLVIGIILFSFSIYVLSIDTILGFNAKSIAFATPIGGLFLIIGWFLLGYRIFKHFN
ncbi:MULTISPECIES: DUF423 domain-containing protein [unclassified Cellulophaga]|uniref:DUF423 domain-containing protein n=1 Tax=unclassified Cellulophaga TaxID=2634405 RepID=UPI0026E1A94E|nr:MULTISPECIES: DUF423 domain-containing protein [unclassified Cellulophaga]MDO6491718.1 DUF423 domain-containing protein [Cellulophaga sp. 2_MG-2023]MDO6495627.1 DUF423 domain-containing protein [Cellulophaga sp. 3_MG-2023]